MIIVGHDVETRGPPPGRPLAAEHEHLLLLGSTEHAALVVFLAAAVSAFPEASLAAQSREGGRDASPSRRASERKQQAAQP